MRSCNGRIGGLVFRGVRMSLETESDEVRAEFRWVNRTKKSVVCEV